MENTDKILVEKGEVFDGNRDQFENCFFSNASNGEIESFCRKNNWSLSINGSVIVN